MYQSAKFSPENTSSKFGLFWRATCVLVLLFTACQSPPTKKSSKIFQTLSPLESGIDFNNALVINDSMNFFSYGYFYMGGGVAIGDFNQDGLKDIYFTGNMVDNKLYLNKGDLQFQDITTTAKVAADNRWVTGCSVVDINNDGWDDISVSVAGKWTNRKNIIFVNQGLNEAGIPTFEDQATALGLADEGGSIQTTFLDYDNDGDLDVFVANYEITPFNAISKDYKKLIDNVSWSESDHLYRNNGDQTFTDVTEAANLLNYSLTVGVATSDFNNDGFTDIYLSNDFHSPDYFYLNNGDGTFREISKESLQHTAFYGMGIDVADYNNDGYLDFMQTDMAAADNFRSKSNMASMNIESFWNVVNYGFHYQYMFNSLQTAQGVKADGVPFYSETAKLSKLDKTDWSWACLFADYDNDGFKDLYITNGTRRDINNRDFFKWLERVDVSLKIKYKELSIEDLTNKMPYKKMDNPIFKNEKGQKFAPANQDWGLHYEGFSNGAAYADLDNDGDLEIIINNIDSTAAIFKNLSVEQSRGNFLQVQLNGPPKNPTGFGTKIRLEYQGQQQYLEQNTIRGYESSVDQKLHFGLGKVTQVEKMVVTWPDGKEQVLTNIAANQLLTVNYQAAQQQAQAVAKPSPIFQATTEKLNYLHQENEYDDFKREILLPHKMSAFGPALATGDVNQDGIEDVFLGAAKGKSPRLYLGATKGGTYQDSVLLDGKEHEDVDAIFFDADGDQDLDLYVVSGGNEAEINDTYYQDRLYQNDGAGNFTLLEDAIPNFTYSGSVVIAADYDQDGDQDLFVGSRQIPGKYPNPATSVLLENKSTPNKISFVFAAAERQAALKNIGMVTDAIWDDFDQDQDLDLVLVGEWMPITFMENDQLIFNKKEIQDFETTTIGWWNTIEKADFDQDGDQDYVLGNLGLNYKYKADADASFDVYACDFDENGKQDIVLGYYQEGVQYPVRGKQCSSEQMPVLKKKFTNYNKFAQAELSQIYTPNKLAESIHYQASEFAHVYLEQLGAGQFKKSPLPLGTQISSVNAIEVFDVNRDGNLDLILGGNLFNAEIETPRADANYGWVLLGNGKGEFQQLSFEQTGIYVPYETRKIKVLPHATQAFLIFANNNAPLSVFSFSTDQATIPIQ